MVDSSQNKAGSYQHSWSFKQNQASLSFTNSQAMQYQLTIPANIKVSLDKTTLNNQAYQDGQFIFPGQAANIVWTASNNSNLDLTNVNLQNILTSSNLQVTTISPNHLDSWPQNGKQTFTISVTAPTNIATGNNQQKWAINYNNQNTLNLGYSLTVPSVTLSLVKAFFSPDNSTLTDNAQILPGTTKTINWQVQNNSSIALSNVSIMLNTSNGQLSLGQISPATLANWAIGDIKTFSLDVSAPSDSNSASHTANWTIKYNNLSVNFTNNQALAYRLTTPPLNCAIITNPSNYSPLQKLDSSGNALVNSSQQWSCVKDNFTGLEWEVKTANNSNLTYSWMDAQSTITATNIQGLCGAHDWRLPTAEELSSLVAVKQSDQLNSVQRIINLDYFPYSQSAFYWSSSESENNSAWGISFIDGSYQAKEKNSSQYIRMVRKL